MKSVTRQQQQYNKYTEPRDDDSPSKNKKHFLVQVRVRWELQLLIEYTFLKTMFCSNQVGWIQKKEFLKS